MLQIRYVQLYVFRNFLGSHFAIIELHGVLQPLLSAQKNIYGEHDDGVHCITSHQ